MNSLAASEKTDLESLAAEWHRAPRRWGHPLHSTCSYFAMFPPQLARYFIKWLSQPGDTVYDPFSGRGTVPLEAGLTGRVALASDANPLAIALSRAKVSIPASRTVLRRLERLEAEYTTGPPLVHSEEPEHIRMLYSDSTLSQLLHLKFNLNQGRVDSYIRALALGMMHANHSAAGPTRGFSVSMPNTFAMSPNYVSKYISEKGLIAPDVDVFGMLAKRAAHLQTPDEDLSFGKTWAQDATKSSRRDFRADLVLTSPPYLQVIKYGKYNWVRLWFLGEQPGDVDAKLTTTASLTKYGKFMESVELQLRKRVKTEGFAALVIGDVRRGDQQINLALDVWERVFGPKGWHLHAIIPDHIDDHHKVSRIWKHNTGKATKIDRILLMSPIARDLPRPPTVDWQEELNSLGGIA